VLVPAKFLIDGERVFAAPREAVRYFHMLFDAHEIVFADGVATESFHPGLQGLGAFEAETREEILSLFPELRHRTAVEVFGVPARPMVKRHEARLLV
jgi:hypothetical protein